MSQPSTTSTTTTDKGAPHEHKNGKCPVSGATSSGSTNSHTYCAPQEGDIRSVCPALNTMANHGFIRRDGQNLSSLDISRGLKACYGLSTPLAAFLAHVGFLLLHKLPYVSRITLHDISIHNRIEHDASLVHHDTPEGEKYAPKDIDLGLVEKLVEGDVQGSNEAERSVLGVEDMGRARVRREAECRSIGSIKQEIARGEMSIILGVWGKKEGEKTGAPVDWIRRWLSEERLPEVDSEPKDGEAKTKIQWTPSRVHGFGEVVKMSKAIKKAAGAIRAKEQAEKDKAEREKEKAKL